MGRPTSVGAADEQQGPRARRWRDAPGPRSLLAAPARSHAGSMTALRRDAVAPPLDDRPLVHVLVVYESMFGATRQVAEAIGEGAARTATVQVRRVDLAQPDEFAAADVLVIGAPTHGHGLPR